MSASEPSFKELVERAQSGDADAFGIIYETHVTPVYRYVFVRTQHREEAEDIVQEAFLKAYEAIGRFETTRENFLPYLFTVARNLLINRGKKKKSDSLTHEEIDRHDGGSDTSKMAESDELTRALTGAMEVLTETEREVVELRFFGEQTYAEIAAILDKKEEAIRQHVARAMKKMRPLMSNYQ